MGPDRAKAFTFSWYFVIFAVTLGSLYGFSELAKLLLFLWLAVVFSGTLLDLIRRSREFSPSVDFSFSDLALAITALAGFVSLAATRSETPALFRNSLGSALGVFSFALLVGLLAKRSNEEAFVLGSIRSFATAGLAVTAPVFLQRILQFVTTRQNGVSPLGSLAINVDVNKSLFLAALVPFYVILLFVDGRNGRPALRLVRELFWLFGLVLTSVHVFSFGTYTSRTLFVISFAFSAVIAWVAFRLLRYNLSEMASQSILTEKRVQRRVFLLLFSLLFLAVLFVVLNWSPESPVFGGLVSKTDRTLEEMRLAWRASFNIWRRARLGGFLGRGAGTFSFHLPFAIADVLERNPEKLAFWNDDVRGTATRVLPELGALGLIGFSMVSLLSLVRWVKAFGNIRRQLGGALRFTVLLSVALTGVVLGLSLFVGPSTFGTAPALLLSFVLGVTFSSYLGPRKSLLKMPSCPVKVTFFRSLTVTALCVVIVLLWTTVGNQAMLVLSDFHLERGLEAFVKLGTVRQRLNDVETELSDLDRRSSQLDRLEGQYEMLNSESWHRFAKAQAERFGSEYDFNKSESERLARIDEEKRKLEERKNSLTDEKAKLEAEVPSLYDRAVSEFVRSATAYRERGDAYFYLGSLALERTRLEQLKKLDERNLRTFFEGKFDELQKITPSHLREDLKVVLGNADPTKETGVREGLIKLQTLLDSIALYQTSAIYRTNRDAYLSLATRYSATYSAMDSLVESVQDDSTRRSLLIAMSRFFNRYVGIALRTTFVWPATWHRFPTHKPVDVGVSASGGDVYRLLAGLTVEVKSPLNEDSRNLVFTLAAREVWACLNLENAGHWGVPDGAFDFVLATAFEHGSANEPAEAIVTLDQLLQLYSEPYSICLRKLNEKSKHAELFSKKLEDLNDRLASILESDDKGYLSKTLGEIFASLFSSTANSFLSGDFRAHLESYYRSLLSRSLKAWRAVPKSSLWKEMVRRTSDNFRYQLEPLYLSEKARTEVDRILDSILNDADMLRFERYALFVAGFEFAKETVVINARKLLELYAKTPEEKIVEAWQGVVLEGAEIKGAEQVINYLNEVVKEYGS